MNVTRIITIPAVRHWDRKTNTEVEKPARQVKVSVDIDVDAIVNGWGMQAARNRTGKSRGLNGLVTAKVRP